MLLLQTYQRMGVIHCRGVISQDCYGAGVLPHAVLPDISVYLARVLLEVTMRAYLSAVLPLSSVTRKLPKLVLPHGRVLSSWSVTSLEHYLISVLPHRSSTSQQYYLTGEVT